jgi:Zn-dependent M28 family amino/carboxypeptidase
MLFLAVTGEEEGLLGSDYYAEHANVPLPQLVADINMDEIATLYDFKDIVPIGAEHSSLEAVINDVAAHFGIGVTPDPSPETVYFIRSDQFSFVRKGVPSVVMTSGYKTSDPNLDGKKIFDEWEENRYHKPGDDMKQPLDFNAAAKYTRIALCVGYEVAQADDRPHWNTGDFFLKFVHSP